MKLNTDPRSHIVTCHRKLWSTHVVIQYQVVIHSHIVIHFLTKSDSQGKFELSNLLFWAIFNNLEIHFVKKLQMGHN